MTDRVIMVFERDVPLAKMRRLMTHGLLWINYSPRNRVAVETIWAGLGNSRDMRVTIADDYEAPTADTLGLWVDNVVLHFPDAETLDLSGFPDLEIGDAVMAEFGFMPMPAGLEGARSYYRATTLS